MTHYRRNLLNRKTSLVFVNTLTVTTMEGERPWAHGGIARALE